MHPDELIVDLMVAVVAFILTVLSLSALNIMRKQGIKKTLWKPVLLSSILFMVMGILSAISAILDIHFFMLSAHIAVFAALTILTYGVHVYLKLIKKGGKVIFIPATERHKGED